MFSIERRSIKKHVHLYFGNQDLERIEEISLSGIKDKRLYYISYNYYARSYLSFIPHEFESSCNNNNILVISLERVLLSLVERIEQM